MNAPVTPAVLAAAVTEASDPKGSDPKARQSRIGIGFALKSLLIVALIAVAADYGMHWWTVGRYQEDTDDAYVGGDLTIIGPKVPGYITALPVTDNQFVHAGDVLVRIDDRDYRANLAKADGAVAAQLATLANLSAAAGLQQAVIARAQAEIRRGRCGRLAGARRFRTL